jgi:hypothetical protein
MATQDDWADISENDFQDMMWACFQNCWHLTEWLRNDPTVPSPQNEAARKMARQSSTLKICGDVCNGTKHLLLTRPKSGVGATSQHINITIVPNEGRHEMDCVVDDGHGNSISGLQLARDSIAEWERILAANGLKTV